MRETCPQIAVIELLDKKSVRPGHSKVKASALKK